MGSGPFMGLGGDGSALFVPGQRRNVAHAVQHDAGAVGVGVQRLAGGIAAVVGEEQVLLFCIGLQTLYHPEGKNATVNV